MKKILFSILLLFSTLTFSNSRLEIGAFKSNITKYSIVKKNLRRNRGIEKKIFRPVPPQDYPGKIEYTPTVSYDFDGFAETMGLYMESGLKQLKKIAIFFVSCLFAIQLFMDLYRVYASGNLHEFLKNFVKRILGFSVYIFAINIIIEGTFFKFVEGLSYSLLKLLTGEPGVEKLSNIWRIKNEVTWNFWQSIANLWGTSSFWPSEFANDLIFTLVLMAVIIFLNIAFFMMMLNLFKALISFKLVLGLSTILIPLGVMDSTKEYYNIGKISSMALNFAIKLISINFIAIVIMKVLTNSNSSINFAVNDVSAALGNNFISFIVLVGVMWHLITKVEINF
ncbi:type IV secretion system protein [Streptobacillus moniliformis]|uniref:type IV secretion system protein n=1 Tax=Streptobacillus moniliformis TaxID=34105 RepID=UPI0007E32CBF|nr:type IV secretion system protein [Streptobacillus moniliformis]